MSTPTWRATSQILSSPGGIIAALIVIAAIIAAVFPALFAGDKHRFRPNGL